VRQKAEAELKNMGELVEPELKKVLAQPPSVEAAQRVEKILAAVAGLAPGSGQLQGLRAVEVLEYVGTPAARELLKSLADGAAGARLTREAQAALLRIEKSAAK
jgi:hypothetical protein